MDKKYKVKIKENPKIYSKIFWDIYKKNKIFRHRIGIYLTVSIITFLFLSSMCYLDFGNIIFSDPTFWLHMIIMFTGIGYIVPICLNRNDVKILYNCYWKLRENLYEKGIYTEEVILEHSQVNRHTF